MSQLILDIKNETVLNKIIKLLEIFQNDGVEIKEISQTKQEVWTDEYIEKNWRKIGMSTHSVNLDDDERLYEACAEFNDDKYSS